MRVVVVDNSGPLGAGPTREVVDEVSTVLDVHYVRETRPGLSRARNAALAADLGAGFVAWIDDDEVADPIWLSESVRALHARPDAAAVSGLVLPAELRTREQVWFEDFGGHSKGRGFTPDVLVPGKMDQSPYFPLPAFGVGANMTFRVEALRSVGGFDEALGAGSPARGGEDTKVFTQVLVAGMSVLYQPSAITRHFHRSDLEGLAAQLYGYGTGLGAYYAALVLDRPWVLWHLARLAPRALRELRSADGLRNAGLGPDFPPQIMSANKRGMLAGPWLYLRGRVRGTRRRRAG
jgi:cellulose synthase/poly-beta-1,6-N-acetylglucosamine synthase-like glycosyltransferase